MPREYFEKINDLIGNCRSTERENIENVKEYLLTKMDSAIKAVEREKEHVTDRRTSDRSNYGNRDQPRVGAEKSRFRAEKDDHDCFTSSHCNQDWHLLGCVKLYQIKTMKERYQFLQSKGACFKCGDKYGGRDHRCDWGPVGKFIARCQSEGCWYAAVTCNHPRNRYQACSRRRTCVHLLCL